MTTLDRIRLICVHLRQFAVPTSPLSHLNFHN
jgi:hypothetical protein